MLIQPAVEFGSFIKQHDPDYYERIVAEMGDFFEKLSVMRLRKSTEGKFRIIYAEDLTSQIVCDFKIGNGKIVGFKKDEVAIGIKRLSNVNLFDMIDSKFIWMVRQVQSFIQTSFKFNLDSTKEEFDNPTKYFQISYSNKEFMRVHPIPEENPN